MEKEKQDAAVAALTEEKTSSDSSTEEKTTEETKDSDKEAPKKVLETKSEAEKDWDNQPAAATLDETPPVKQEKEESEETEEVSKEQVTGLSKEKERLLDDIKTLRSKKKEAKAETVDSTLDESVEYTTEEETLDQKLDKKILDREAQNEFYTQYPDFYSGVEGMENRKLVEDYITTRFGSLTKFDSSAQNELRQSTHLKYFGTYEKDMIERKAKNQARDKSIMDDLATTGSDKGSTSIKTKQKPRKRILPKQKSVEEWY